MILKFQFKKFILLFLPIIYMKVTLIKMTLDKYSEMVLQYLHCYLIYLLIFLQHANLLIAF